VNALLREVGCQRILFSSKKSGKMERLVIFNCQKCHKEWEYQVRDGQAGEVCPRCYSFVPIERGHFPPDFDLTTDPDED
jgi:hypothetical protein